MEFIECPECKQMIDNTVKECPHCGFDIQLYQSIYNDIFEKKLRKERASKQNNITEDISYKIQHTYITPKCPTCGSTDLTKITSLDRAVNIAMFGLLGNKRKYQWHCNNCKYNW